MLPSALVPTSEEAGLARDCLKALRPLARGARSAKPRALQLQAEGSTKTITLNLPQEALNRFLEVLAQMANGNAVTIVPVHAEFTTQQAADYLNVSRPFLVSLLESNKLPYRFVGSHRRIRFADLHAFKAADDRQRLDVLAELAADAQSQGHGY